MSERPKVIDGRSNLWVDIFGERGKHARAAVAMTSLPFEIRVEIQMIVEVDPRQALAINGSPNLGPGRLNTVPPGCGATATGTMSTIGIVGPET